MSVGGKFTFALVLVLSLVAASCGDDDASETDTGADAGDDTEEVLQNACPADGCVIDFAAVEKSGDELEVTWDINFDPDINNNHIHIYWDNFTAEQVSDDATDRGVDQGEWVPTDAGPTYVTEGAVSTSVRGDSTTLCLVAADRDHNVLDVDAEICQDVSEFL